MVVRQQILVMGTCCMQHGKYLSNILIRVELGFLLFVLPTTLLLQNSLASTFCQGSIYSRLD